MCGRVGIIGHSEGGTIALMLAAEGAPDFVVCLAGAIIKGKDLILAQNLHFLEMLPGITDKQTADALTLVGQVFDDVITGKDAKEIDIDSYISAQNLDIPAPVLASFRQNLASGSNDYFRELISLDPSQWLGKIKVPVFGLNGTLDTQVACTTNLPALKKAVKKLRQKNTPTSITSSSTPPPANSWNTIKSPKPSRLRCSPTSFHLSKYSESYMAKQFGTT